MKLKLYVQFKLDTGSVIRFVSLLTTLVHFAHVYWPH